MMFQAIVHLAGHEFWTSSEERNKDVANSRVNLNLGFNRFLPLTLPEKF